MAPSNNCTLIALLLVAFAVVLQPSSAIRVVEGALARATASSATEAAAPSSPDGGGIPPLPPQPRECRPWLMRMMPCSGFITNSSVYAPEPTCCDGFNSMFSYDTVTCLCHVVNGDVGRLLPAPMIHMRMVELFSVCGHDVPVEILAAACNMTVDDVPPIDLPSPPPSTPLPLPAASAIAVGRMAMIN
ncbi:hypothetical protein SETIT_2G128500v2 [Setaria italica]|uniref:Bifunctional inhibitor/plant lipid transfer protein/seed storage helical domain-containing protein n=2 Tax=Setaria italica TaxID=4555 RepID=A0A368PYJ5_SETIT|nr:hypothetical protein SETIT_2G128500v2 [Setaria italica]